MSSVKDFRARIRALPRQLTIGDFFSGAGTCCMVIAAALSQLHRILPEEDTQGLEACGHFTLHRLLFQFVSQFGLFSIGY